MMVISVTLAEGQSSVHAALRAGIMSRTEHAQCVFTAFKLQHVRVFLEFPACLNMHDSELCLKIRPDSNTLREQPQVPAL